MVTDFIYVCLHIFFIYVFFTDVAGEGIEDRPPRPLWLIAGQKEMVASVLICLVHREFLF